MATANSFFLSSVNLEINFSTNYLVYETKKKKEKCSSELYKSGNDLLKNVFDADVGQFTLVTIALFFLRM